MNFRNVYHAAPIVRHDFTCALNLNTVTKERK
jgi:hypothetical protein